MATSFAYCRLDQVDELTAFIHDHWSSEHVLVKSRALLDWQHRDAERERYNFLLAEDAGVGIAGILGFIPTSRYDPAFVGLDETIWLTTWKVRSDFAHGLGLMLLRGIMMRTAPARIGTVGLNPATRPIYQALGFQTGKLARYFLLNPDISAPKLAEVPSGLDRTASALPGAIHRFTPLAEQDLVDATRHWDFGAGGAPRRSVIYMLNRYLHHPFYRYQAHLATGVGNKAALLITRLCHHEKASAMRVVDVLAAPGILENCAAAFSEMLATSGAEYLDFYCSGHSDALVRAGLRDLAEYPDLVLPSYFEPFVPSNVDLNYSILNAEDNALLCKGDADQDRPSRLPEVSP